jgi:hypothetical protein
MVVAESGVLRLVHRIAPMIMINNMTSPPAILAQGTNDGVPDSGIGEDGGGALTGAIATVVAVSVAGSIVRVVSPR